MIESTSAAVQATQNASCRWGMSELRRQIRRTVIVNLRNRRLVHRLLYGVRAGLRHTNEVPRARPEAKTGVGIGVGMMTGFMIRDNT